MLERGVLTTEGTAVDRIAEIRVADLADLDRVQAVDRKVFEHVAYPYFVLRQMWDVYRNCLLVADHPSGLAGYSLGVPTPDRRSGWLLALAVVPDQRGRGWGRRLTLASLCLLRSMGVAEVFLTVEPRNRTAMTLYRGIGFSVAGLHHNYLGDGEDRVVMARPFAGSVPHPADPSATRLGIPRDRR
jgi:[ribosomal protein S18]-alanine N-acetyltransferase